MDREALKPPKGPKPPEEPRKEIPDPPLPEGPCEVRLYESIPQYPGVVP